MTNPNQVTTPLITLDRDDIDVSTMAREHNITCPVNISRRAWMALVHWEQANSAQQIFQTQSLRLRNLLACAANTICASKQFAGKQNYQIFSVFLVVRDGFSRKSTMVSAKLIWELDEQGDIGLMITLPDEVEGAVSDPLLRDYVKLSA